MKKIFTLVAAVFVAASAFAQTEISELIKGKTSLELQAGTEYTLNASAVLEAGSVVTINGNGATIKVGAEGMFVAQKGIVLNKVVVDASEATKSLINLEADAAKILPELYTMQDGVSKYEGGSQNMPESDKVAIIKSTIKNLPQGLVAGNAQQWAIDELTVENSIIAFNASSITDSNANQSGFAFGSVKVLTIDGTTIYNVAANTGNFLFRLKNQSQAGKVWGNNPKNTHVFTIKNSTLVNALGSKDIANNWYSNGSFTVVLDNNIFYDCFRVKSKFVGNCSFDKTGTPSKNLFDHSEGYNLDGSENQVATLATTGIVKPTAETGFDMNALGACFATPTQFGDPRWNQYVYPFNLTAVIESEGKTKQQLDDQKVAVKLNGDKTAVTVALPANELKGWKMAAAVLTIPCTVEGNKINVADAAPAESLVFVNPANENVTATDVKVSGSFQTGTQFAYAMVTANVPGIGNVSIQYSGVFTGINNIAAPAAQSAKTVKAIQNGRIVIMNGGNTYNVAGQIVK